MTTPRDFASALLGALGMPVTPNNVMALIAFQAQEGGFMHNTAFYNPLNTSLVYKSVTAKGFSSPAIQAYPDWSTGLAATVKTLRNGLYGGILAALQSSAAPDTTLQAVKNSPFGWYYMLDPMTSSSCGATGQPACPSNAVKIAIEPQLASALQYEADMQYPPGPSPFSTLSGTSGPFAGSAPSFGPNVTQAGVGAVLAFGFWKFYEFLGRH